MIHINILRFSKKIQALLALGASSLLFSQSHPKFDRIFQTMYEAKKSGVVPDAGAMRMPGVDHINPAGKNGAEVLYSAIIYTKNPQALKKAGIKVQSVMPKFVTALVSLNDLDLLNGLQDVEQVKAPRVRLPTNNISVAQTGASLLQAGILNNTVYKGKGVLVGIYDTGNYFKHPDFRDAADQTNSRILKMWDQTITPAGTDVSPTGFSYGVEYTQKQINDEINGVTSGAVREADTGGHGTHVAGTAAGNGMALPSKKYAGMAPEANYIIVKGGNGGFNTSNIIDGLTYFNTVATSLNMPIVVNMSIGGQFSAHDGTDDEDVAVDQFSQTPGHIVAIAAGNDNGSNVHKQLSIAPGASGSVSFTVPANTTATDLFEFLLYTNSNGAVTATITDNNGNTATVNPDSNTPTGGTSLGTGFSYNAYDYVDSNNNNRYVDVYVTRKTGSTVSSAGTWTLTFTNNGSSAVTADGWLAYVNKAMSITVNGGDSNMLVGTPGDAKSAITVAAYTGKLQWYSNNTGTNTSGGYAYTATNKKTDAISTFSSVGPLRDGTQKPDIAAPGEAVISALSPGTITTASTSNVDGTYYQVMSGTSMATPATAGAIALLLQAKPTATAAEIKNLLTSTAAKDNATGATLPAYDWGYGKLDVFQAMSKLTAANRIRKTYINETYPYSLASDAGLTCSTERLAESFTPDLTGYLGGVYFATSATYSGLTSYTIEVRSSKNGVPDVLLGSKTIDATAVGRFNWNYFDMSDLKAKVVSGQDYFIVIYTAGNAQKWSLRTQATNANNRSLKSMDNGATWAPDTVGYRIRSVAYSDPSALATADVHAATVQVYPNPATDILKVQLVNNEKSSLKIYDMGGRLVKSMEAASSHIEINVAPLLKGEYLLNISTPTQKITKKFLKN